MTAIQPQSFWRRTRLWALAAVGAAAIAGAGAWRTLLSDQASGDFGLGRAAAQGGVPAEKLRELWATGRLPERRAALGALAAEHRRRPELEPLWRQWLTEAALDPDDGIRLKALGEVRSTDAAAAPETLHGLGWQLSDSDPDLRRAAVTDLQRAAGPAWTPWLLPMLGDPDIGVAFAADAALRTWNSRDSGLRVAMTLGADPAETAKAPARLKEAARDWGDWWRRQPAALNPPPALPPKPALARRPAPPFALRDLEGRRVSLSDFLGKTVVVNFWTTWCTACITELPTLVELQRLHPDLVVLGVSLDAPDAGSADEHGDHDDGDQAPDRRTRTEILRSLRQAVEKHHLNYPVLWDPDMKAGNAYLGGELPTQAILDRQGRLVRRFVGPRTLPVWEALLAETDGGR